MPSQESRSEVSLDHSEPHTTVQVKNHVVHVDKNSHRPPSQDQIEPSGENGPRLPHRELRGVHDIVAKLGKENLC
jgi:hypothetical protein